jgi:hypothetical protein
MPLIVKLAMRAVQQLGWKLDTANEAIGLVMFSKYRRGIPKQISCEGTGKQNVRGGQILALNLFGEAEGKARKAVDLMRQIAESGRV